MADHVAWLVNDWLSTNVHNYPLEDKENEVVRLVAVLTSHMRDEGCSREEVEDHIGNLQDRVEAYFEQVQDPDLGFRD